MQRFTLPRDMYHGRGVLEALKTPEGKEAIVRVGGGSIRRGGFPDCVVAYLRETGMEVRLSEGVRFDPSVKTVMRRTDETFAFGSDQIVAMSGESPIDAVGAVWIKYEYPEITSGDMCRVFGIPKLRRKTQFCAISSTSGTATEVATFSVIMDYQKGIKYPTAGFEIIPDIATVNPDLIMTVPIKLVVYTGMDAVTHAVEAYVFTASSNFTDPLAIHTIEMIKEHLVKSYNGDMDSHVVMHDAQCLAGQTSSSAFLGIVRPMAHKIGAVFVDQDVHIVHDVANAMYLSKVIRFSAKDEAVKKHYGVITDYMHLGDSNDEEKMDLLVTCLCEMSDALHIPHCVAHYGKDGLPTEEGFVSEDVLLTCAKDIAANVILDACTGDNPRQPSQEEMVKLLKCCYYNTEVDFQCRN